MAVEWRSSAFTQPTHSRNYVEITSSTTSTSLSATNDEKRDYIVTGSISNTRRAFLSSIVATTSLISSQSPGYADDDVGVESIAARAARIAKAVEAQEDAKSNDSVLDKTDSRTAYDFSLPIAGNQVSFADIIKQEYVAVDKTIKMKNSEGVEEDSIQQEKIPKVKAILVVNIKQDDPVARKDIAEFITLASKFGRTGEFVVICSPTDQGYFEPDTSTLIRLKLAQEYGYGINPATVATDKVNLLGTGAHPFWRWIEGTCRTPSGLGKIQANFEKFLVDGRTGKAVRRYPRKYQPFDIIDDIDAVVKGKTLPPAGANWREEWRNAEKEAEKDTYRFQKGLNVFDQ